MHTKVVADSAAIQAQLCLGSGVLFCRAIAFHDNGAGIGPVILNGTAGNVALRTMGQDDCTSRIGSGPPILYILYLLFNLINRFANKAIIGRITDGIVLDGTAGHTEGAALHRHGCYILHGGVRDEIFQGGAGYIQGTALIDLHKEAAGLFYRTAAVFITLPNLAAAICFAGLGRSRCRSRRPSRIYRFILFTFTLRFFGKRNRVLGCVRRRCATGTTGATGAIQIYEYNLSRLISGESPS